MNDSRPTRLNVALVLIVLALGIHPLISHANNSVATMAGIVLSLQHYPSDADKQALAAIAGGDGSPAVKSVAAAIAGIAHKVSDADRATLEAIAADESQPADLRELAGIVAGINHVPSADAKAALAKLAGG